MKRVRARKRWLARMGDIFVLDLDHFKLVCTVYVGTAQRKYKDWAGIEYPMPKPRGFDELR